MSLDLEDLEYDSFHGVDSHLSSSNISYNDQSQKKKGKARTSFIWNYCKMIDNGWECIVKTKDDEPCGTKFLLEHTKGSTSNTLYHLQNEHNLLRPELSKKVLIYIISK